MITSASSDKSTFLVIYLQSSDPPYAFVSDTSPLSPILFCTVISDNLLASSIGLKWSFKLDILAFSVNVLLPLLSLLLEAINFGVSNIWFILGRISISSWAAYGISDPLIDFCDVEIIENLMSVSGTILVPAIKWNRSICLFSVAVITAPPPDPVAEALLLPTLIVYESCLILFTECVPLISAADKPLNAVAPEITTVEFPCIEWFLCLTTTLVLPLVDDKLSGKSFLGWIVSLTNVTSFSAVTSNCALFKVNLRSLLWSGVHVEAFWDVKNEPPWGCLLIL